LITILNGIDQLQSDGKVHYSTMKYRNKNLTQTNGNTLRRLNVK
jgi:hypothetical protein